MNLPINPEKKFKYSITFSSWDEESMEIGETDNKGFEYEDDIDTIGEILHLALDRYGIYYPMTFGGWESTEPIEDSDYFTKGIRKYYTLHVKNEDGTDITQEENDFITFLLSDGRYEIDKFREYAIGGIVGSAIAVGVGLIAYYYFKGKKPKSQKAKKVKKSVKYESSQSTTKKNISSSAKSVTHMINGKKRKFPIKDAWRKEHNVENKKEKYEVPQEDRFAMGGDASEYYHEVEYGEGGVARAKDVIMNKIGYNEETADYFVGKSEKFAIWLADSILKEELRSKNYNKKQWLDSNYSSWRTINANYGGGIREILDWLQHPVTPKQELRQLSFQQALEKAREWHNELQVLGGDIDFTEPEKNTILKKYPKNDEGVEYYWVFIPSNYCDLESSRMGHCGRTGYGNNLISLRSVRPYGKGHTVSDSHVTIAYGVNDGIFYQVKGKKNQKPAEKYFPYIFDLIKSILNREINQKFDEEYKKLIKVVEFLSNEQKKIKKEIEPYINGYLVLPSSTEMKFLKGEMSRGDFERVYNKYVSDQIPASYNFQKIYILNEKLNEVRNNREYEEINNEIDRLREEVYSLITENITNKYKEIIRLEKEQKQAEKDLLFFQQLFLIDFNGFGSEYGDSEDYGYEDMTKEQLRELYDLKPSIFNDAESVLSLYDAGVITDVELQNEYQPNSPNSIFSSFGNQMKLYDRGVILEKPSTTFELNYSCDEVYRLLDVKGYRDDIVEEILCGDVGELSDSWSYYYENASDLVGNLNKENEQAVIDEIVRITGYEKSDVEENGIEYYLNGEDENFPSDDFDNIIRVLASAQNSADQSDYHAYLYDNLKSSLEELGEVHSLNDEGVKMTIDLSNLMSDEEIAEAMDRYEFSDVADLFYEEINNSYGGAIDRPSLSIDDRYSPYGSEEDFNAYVSDADLEQGYAKGGYLKTKNNTKDMKAIKKTTKRRTIKKQPKIVRQYFEDSPYSYAKGGGVGSFSYDYYEVYDESTGKSLMIYAIDQEDAESIAEELDFESFEDGDEYNPNEEYAEGGEIEDWMEEALESLIEETGNDDLEITIVSDNGNEFYCEGNDAEYRVFKTEDDAEEMAVEQVREDLENNPEYFGEDWLMGHIDGADFFERAIEEKNYSYANDIQYESDEKYENRLIAEMVEYGILDEDDAESDEADTLAELKIDDFVSLLTKDAMDMGGDGLEYFIDNFGEEETLKMVIDNNLIDVDEASKDAVNLDGIGHFLSSYDGETVYLSNDSVAYRTN